MDEKAIAQHIVTLPNVQSSENFGYQFFFYGDDHRLPFATIANSDNDFDSVSHLDRPDVYRLNIGISKQRFQAIFGAEEVPQSAFDFTELDKIMPHPDYAKQFFVCVLSPSDTTLPTVLDMLAEAHDIAKTRYERNHPA
jgi:hypothetical protein